MAFVGGARRPFRHRTPSDLVKDVLHSLDQSRAVLYKIVAPTVTPRRDIARYRQHVPALFERGPSGDQGPTLQVRLDHHNGPREAADDPIPQREVWRQRCRAGWELRYQRAPLQNRG